MLFAQLSASWEGDCIKSTIQLMSELAAHKEVLYVDYQYTVKDVIKAIFKILFIFLFQGFQDLKTIKKYHIGKWGNDLCTVDATSYSY